MRVPGSNPGGTIFILHNQSYTILFISYIYIITDPLPIYFIYIQYNPCNYNFFPFYRPIILIFLFVSFKKAAEGSFDQPTCKLWACRATTAPPRFICYSLFSLTACTVFLIFWKKLHRRESNPGHKRERLVCYQLHHNGLLFLLPDPSTRAVLSVALFFFCWDAVPLCV